MKRFDNKKGFALAFVIMIILVLSIAIPSFYSLAFSHYNVAILDGYRQQACYNAHSGVEYALFILAHPADYPTPTDFSTWPMGNTLQCPGGGTATVSSITSDGAGGFSITSTGTINNTITAVVNAHYIAGIIDTWS